MRGRGLQRRAVGLHVGDHAGHRGDAELQRLGGVEQRLLVFLIVFVVSQWLALHQGHKRHQVSEHAATFSAHKLRDVGVFLLRHDR